MDYEHLDKEIIKRKLIDASLYLMAFHLLKSAIVDGVKNFFLTGFKDKELTYSEDYESKVLSRSKYKFEASLIFLVEVGAITQSDVDVIHELRDYRNKLAHDIPSSIYENGHSVDPKKIETAGSLLNKIDNFWGRVEVDTDPDLVGQDVDYEGIQSIRSIVFQYIAEIVREEGK